MGKENKAPTLREILNAELAELLKKAYQVEEIPKINRGLVVETVNAEGEPVTVIYRIILPKNPVEKNEIKEVL